MSWLDLVHFEPKGCDYVFEDESPALWVVLGMEARTERQAADQPEADVQADAAETTSDELLAAGEATMYQWPAWSPVSQVWATSFDPGSKACAANLGANIRVVFSQPASPSGPSDALPRDATEDEGTTKQEHMKSLHAMGVCRPCRYHISNAGGCWNGFDCDFCHFCDKASLKASRRRQMWPKRPNAANEETVYRSLAAYYSVEQTWNAAPPPACSRLDGGLTEGVVVRRSLTNALTNGGFSSSPVQQLQ
eukprot:TRINITY_DN38331_c0_g1_i1.p1 TRINITY_DN38331_c0_g1~~TRINITY_DN38331_c0_g1_i1.p1  ORF type:complete len:250 (-),score=41.90 TRINITY_DN38331_c0_g1_i1:400-1149(-)